MAGLMSLAMVALVGCNKENNAPSADGAEATVSVRVQGAATRANAYEPGAGKNDMNIYTLAAMVYNGDVQEAYKTAEKGATEITDIQCTAGRRQLVVVANFGAMKLEGITLSKLKEMQIELNADQQNPEKMLHLMTSEVTNVDIKAGKNKYGYDEEGALSKQPLKITHVHAGMELKEVTTAFKEPFKSQYSIKLDGEGTELIGLIVKKQSKIFGESLVFGDSFIYGENHFGKSDKKYTPEVTPENPNLYTEEKSLKINFDGKDYSQAGFYILENDSKKHPTILTIKTKLLDNAGQELTEDAKNKAFEAGYCDVEGFTYYPVLVNWDKKGYTYTGDGADEDRNAIKRNRKYSITLTITGPGTNQPEEPTNEPATLDVKIEVAKWIPVAQNVEW